MVGTQVIDGENENEQHLVDPCAGRGLFLDNKGSTPTRKNRGSKEKIQRTLAEVP